MICAHCHRHITKASAMANGKPFGPVCAERLGLIEQKPLTKLQTARRKWKAFWQAQRDLFEGVV